MSAKVPPRHQRWARIRTGSGLKPIVTCSKTHTTVTWLKWRQCTSAMDGFYSVQHDPYFTAPTSWQAWTTIAKFVKFVISVHAFQLHTTLCSLACTVDVHWRVCHTWMTFRQCKPNGTMTRHTIFLWLKTRTLRTTSLIRQTWLISCLEYVAFLDT